MYTIGRPDSYDLTSGMMCTLVSQFDEFALL